jgi:hypothetical protein
VLRNFIKGIACIRVRDAGIFAEETDSLTAAVGEEVEVVDVWDTAQFLVGGTCSTDVGMMLTGFKEQIGRKRNGKGVEQCGAGFHRL